MGRPGIHQSPRSWTIYYLEHFLANMIWTAAKWNCRYWWSGNFDQFGLGFSRWNLHESVPLFLLQRRDVYTVSILPLSLPFSDYSAFITYFKLFPNFPSCFIYNLPVSVREHVIQYTCTIRSWRLEKIDCCNLYGSVRSFHLPQYLISSVTSRRNSPSICTRSWPITVALIQSIKRIAEKFSNWFSTRDTTTTAMSGWLPPSVKVTQIMDQHCLTPSFKAHEPKFMKWTTSRGFWQSYLGKMPFGCCRNMAIRSALMRASASLLWIIHM